MSPDRRTGEIDVRLRQHAPSSPFSLGCWFKGSRISGEPRGPDRRSSTRSLDMTLFHRLIFDTSQLTQFINRTPKLRTYDEARVLFPNGTFVSRFHGPLRSAWVGDPMQTVRLATFIYGRKSAAVLPQALIFAVEHLYMSEIFTATIPALAATISRAQCVFIVRKSLRCKGVPPAKMRA